MGIDARQLCFRYSRSPDTSGKLVDLVAELLRNQFPRASKRSVGEPAEGSLPREGLRAPGGFGLHLFTHCVPTSVALAGHGVRLSPASGLVSARRRPFKFCL